MEEPQRACESLVGRRIEIVGESGTYCQKCLFEDMELGERDPDELRTPSIVEGEPVCVTVSRKGETHPDGATEDYIILDVFHPYHLVPGDEIEAEEQGYHEITISTTAVSGTGEDDVVIDDDPEVIRYSPPHTGSALE